MTTKHTHKTRFRKAVSTLILLCFLIGQVFSPASVSAQSILNLPVPGAMVSVSPGYVPIAIKGLKVYPDNPFRFDFILDTGNSKLQGQELNDEAKLLIKYFLTALTVPDDDQWVNLSPYEKDRIIPKEFGITEMGRDLLAQDYLLKQLTVSLTNPETDLGKKYWDQVNKTGTLDAGGWTLGKNNSTNVQPLATSVFNKVWIMPDHAKVYESGQMAFITESHLKVMLESDYVALATQQMSSPHALSGDPLLKMDSRLRGNDKGEQTNALGSQILREIVLPEIEKEVNEGKNFTKLRQIYHSMIMAAWFKRKLKDGMLSKIYVGANKVAGVDVDDKEIKQKIYDQYLAAFKKGVYNYIKEEVDETTQETMPRKYFAGGFTGGQAVAASTVVLPVSENNLVGIIKKITLGSLRTAYVYVAPFVHTPRNTDPHLDSAALKRFSRVFTMKQLYKYDRDLAQLLQTEGQYGQDLERSFMVAKNLFGDKFDEILPAVFELGKGDGAKSINRVLDLGLPRMKRIFGDRFDEYWPSLFELGKADKADIISLYSEVSLDSIKAIFGDPKHLNEYLPILLEVSKSDLSEGMSSLFIALVGAKNLFGAPLSDYLPDLLQLCKGNRKTALALLEQDLPKVKKVFGARFYEYWPTLVVLGKEAGGNVDDLFEHGLAAVKDLINNVDDLKNIGSVVVELVNNSARRNQSSYFLFGVGLRYPSVHEHIKNADDLKRIGKKLMEIQNFDSTFSLSSLDERSGREPDFDKLLEDSLKDLLPWEGHEANIRYLSQLVSTGLYSQALATEIMKSVVPNYVNIFARLIDSKKKWNPENTAFNNFVLNADVDLGSRMILVDYYLEILAIEEVLDNDNRKEKPTATVDIKDAVGRARSNLNTVMSELLVGGLSKSKRTRILGKAKIALNEFRKEFLKNVIGRPLTDREVRLLEDREINQKIMTILSIAGTLRVVSFSQEELMRRLVKDSLNTLFTAYNSAEARDPVAFARDQLNNFLKNLDVQDLSESVSQVNAPTTTYSNKKIVEELVANGYSHDLWTKGIDLQVEVSNGITEEGKRESIRNASFEMVEIALALGITKVDQEEVSLARASLIDSYAKAQLFVQSLKAAEKRIPEDKMDRLEDILFYIQGQDSQKIMDVPQKSKFSVTIKKDFLNEAAAGINVPGCFSPTGIHREMPLIHALEANAGFIQVYADNGTQVANAVILYTKEGVYADSVYSSSFYDMDEVFGKALSQLTAYVPRLVLGRTSAGYKYLSRYAKISDQTVVLVKPATIFSAQYFDARVANDSGQLSFEIGNPLIVTKENIVAKDGELGKFIQQVEVQANEVAPKTDTTKFFEQLALHIIQSGDKYKKYLFLISAIKKRVAEEGETIVNDGFYDWIYSAITTNSKTADVSTEESDEVADIIVDFFEAQEWPIRLDTPPREINKAIEVLETKAKEDAVADQSASSSLTEQPQVASTPRVAQADKSKNLGGIDMNQKALDLQTEGEGIKFDMPFDPAQLQNIQIDGFSPVILQIVPTNLPLFIGKAEIPQPAFGRQAPL